MSAVQQNSQNRSDGWLIVSIESYLAMTKVLTKCHDFFCCQVDLGFALQWSCCYTYDVPYSLTLKSQGFIKRQEQMQNRTQK